MADGARSYSDDELAAILRRALEKQAAGHDNFGHDELMAAAREVGLDEQAVESAIAELSHERTLEDIRESIRRKRLEKWRKHLVTYLAVVGGFLGLHLVGLVGAWVYWMAFGWGIGLALDTYSKLRQPTDEEVHKERERLNRHERRKRQAEARREAKRRRAEERAARKARKVRRGEAGEQLERVIEDGVTLLLGVAAKKLREATAQMEREHRVPNTDFGRYVARKHAETHGDAPREPREAPRVRVELDEEELEHELEKLRRRRSKKRR
ncbi:MAG TPA: 2TM domain-containing protein [Polyangiaceae bacterium]|nr:2TM domain-containing protein [Polyangiaceae bacterium]